MWSKPEYTEFRFGFEVTMYIAEFQRIGMKAPTRGFCFLCGRIEESRAH